VHSRTRAGALIGASALLIAVPGVAEAKTKSVYMGTPPTKAAKALEPLGTDVNDYFPHTISINVGDKVKFLPVGFHTVDLPARGSQSLAFAAPNGTTVAGSNDAMEQPFWFNGQPNLSFNPPLLAQKFGKTVTYNTKKRAESGLPLAPKPKPFTVKFAKTGNFTVYCDLHPGMTGIVRVKAKKTAVPSAKQDKKAVDKQVARSIKNAKSLAKTIPPQNAIDVGVAGPHGEEFFGFAPANKTVPVGTRLTFRMSPGSHEEHTATTGPGDPEADPSSYLGQISASFQTASFDPRGVYPSENPAGPGAALTPALHGNGFWSSGVLDTATASPLPESNSVTFGAPGTYTFYCMIHPFMKGTVTVQ